MIVMKFGGSSVGSASRIRRVLEIVNAHREREPVVVVSALKGVTDLLFQIAERAATSGETSIAAIRERYVTVLTELELDAAALDPGLAELGRCVEAVAARHELTPAALAEIVSFGERLAADLIARFFTQEGVEASAHDAGRVGLLTESRFPVARPLPESYERIPQQLGAAARGIPVVTGYIGRDAEGRVTTLGRDGSDFSASIIGSAYGAEEIQIWTDVDGVMNADPRVVPEATVIERMSFEEASEVAYFGAKVLHPSTISPAVRRGIPVRVCNTGNPQHPGTLILKSLPKPEASVVRAVVAKASVTLINIVSSRMLAQHGFLAKVFEVFGRHEVVIDVIATSEVSISVTIDALRGVEDSLKELREFSDVSVVGDQAILCVVGKGIDASDGVAERIFRTLGRERIKVNLISMAGVHTNISLIVSSADGQRAVRALHASFFGPTG